MDLLNIKPTSDLIQSRGEATRSYQYSPHLLYSPHVLYPVGYMYGIFPNVDIVNAITSSTVIPLTSKYVYGTNIYNSFHDNFDDNSINYSLWNIWGTGIAEVNNRIEMTSILSTGYMGIQTADVGSPTKNLTNSDIFCEVVSAGNQAIESWETYPLQFIKDNNNYLQFRIIGGIIQEYKKVGGSLSQVGENLTYDSSLHRWFRIRETNGVVYFDLSTDGTDWENLSSVSTPFSVSAGYFEISCGTWKITTETTQLIIDNFNYLPAPQIESPKINLINILPMVDNRSIRP